MLVGGRFAALRVALARPKPSSAGELRAYRRLFGGSVTFAAARSHLVYSRAALQKPIPTSDLRLALLLRQQAETRLQRSERPVSLREQVFQHLSAELRSGKPDPGELARSLRMSGRTLRRKLSAVGCS
jgi:hypothetical protein